jgi:hypothetical protein
LQRRREGHAQRRQPDRCDDAALRLRVLIMTWSARKRSKITPPNRPATSMATYCTLVTRPTMLPAISTTSQTLATRNRSSPIDELHSPDQTVSTARSVSGRKMGSTTNLLPRHTGEDTGGGKEQSTFRVAFPLPASPV